METAKHSLEMGKRQIAIPSSSKRDKGLAFQKTLLVLSLSPVRGRTLKTKSLACEGETANDQQVLSLQSLEGKTL